MNLPFSLIQVFDDPMLNFKGNTAVVLLLDQALSPEKMQEIAADFSQPATTFLWRENKDGFWKVRWFAPDGEIDLCGHGSLAAIAFLSNNNASDNFTLKYGKGTISGTCLANKCTIEMEPITIVKEIEPSELLCEALRTTIKSHFVTDNKHILVLENEEQVRNLKPDFARLRQSEIFGYAVTAPGHTVDFVSRTLVPHVQQLEDPATGSSHAALVPYWSQRLGKTKMTALQLSRRGGKFYCEMGDQKVRLSGSFTVLAEGSWLAD